MELIERYIHEVGRYLPGKNRGDIQAELRSLLSDALEDSAGAEPNETVVIAALKKFGSPRSVAAKYYPEGQYLIGPALYPLFQMIVWIVIAAVCGSQILAWVVAYLLAGETVNPVSAVAGLVTSIPAALGWVVVVFFILQRFDVRPGEPEAEWDPTSLPQIAAEVEIKRGERIASIIFETFLLAVVTLFPERIGAYFFPGGIFFGNPVLSQYLGWISLSLLVSIVLDIYLVWQGRWNTANRLALLGANLFSIAVLGLLVQGHTAWLQAHGVINFATAIEKLTEDILANGQIVTMWAFWLGFSVALIVTVIETIGLAVRLVCSKPVH
jgi:uncharacterized membrane protein